MNPRRALPIAITAAAVVLSTAAVPALAKHGADDPPGDDRGGQVTTTTTASPAPTQAGDDNGGGRDDSGGSRRRAEVRVAGRCTGRSTAKLKAKHDDGRLETELEVDQNRNGVRWNVQIKRNGNVAVRTSAVTRSPSGSFSVERRIGDGAGADRITARATSPSGEVCTASLSIS